MTTYSIDNAHSDVSFSVRHMMVSTVKGRFNGIRGTITDVGDDPSRSSVDIEIDAASLTTSAERRLPKRTAAREQDHGAGDDEGRAPRARQQSGDRGGQDDVARPRQRGGQRLARHAFDARASCSAAHGALTP